MSDRRLRRWNGIIQDWQGAELGEQPPSWLAEFPTATELTIKELHSDEEIEDDDSSWQILREACHNVGAGEPSESLRPRARELLEALLASDEDDGATTTTKA